METKCAGLNCVSTSRVFIYKTLYYSEKVKQPSGKTRGEETCKCKSRKENEEKQMRNVRGKLVRKLAVAMIVSLTVGCVAPAGMGRQQAVYAAVEDVKKN